MWDLLNALCVPAFLTDPFSDFVGVNRSLLSLHGISVQELQAFKSTAVGVNNLGLLFASGTSFKTSAGARVEVDCTRQCATMEGRHVTLSLHEPVSANCSLPYRPLRSFA